MQRHHADPGVFIRSMATRGATGGLARTTAALARLFRSAGFDFVLIETVGVGQDEIDIAALADVTVVVLVPGMGDDVQAIKAGIMEIADIFVINKADRPGAEQTQREIEAMLSLGTVNVPPIFRTVAIDGTGVAELAATICETRRRKRHAAAPPNWEIDHLGIAVRSLDEALPFYATHLGLPVLSRETVEHEKVNVAMLPAGTSRIELLEPLDASFHHREISREARPRPASCRHARPRSARHHSASRKRGRPAARHAPARRRRTPLRLRPSGRAPVAYYGNLFRNQGATFDTESASSAAADSTPCPAFTQRSEVDIETPFGAPSDNYIVGELEGHEVAFLARHGRGHRLSPSELNFRANIYGMKTLGVERILSLSAVGSLKEEHRPLDFVIPDQFFDRTRGRISTFFGEGLVAHVSFADPVCPQLSDIAEAACRAAGVNVKRGGTYICMEGPAFSTKAESNLYRSWGMDVIGMTNLQEAKLAREAEICYVTIAMVTDYDCWHEEHDAVEVTDIIRVLQQNAANACQVVAAGGEDHAGRAHLQVRLGARTRPDHGQSSRARAHSSEAGTDCRQVFRVAKPWRPSGAANACPPTLVRALGEEQPAEFFRVIVESLADSFDPAQAAAYEDLMRAWIPATRRRVEPAIPERVETVLRPLARHAGRRYQDHQHHSRCDEAPLPGCRHRPRGQSQIGRTLLRRSAHLASRTPITRAPARSAARIAIRPRSPPPARRPPTASSSIPIRA